MVPVRHARQFNHSTKIILVDVHMSLDMQVRDSCSKPGDCVFQDSDLVVVAAMSY